MVVVVVVELVIVLCMLQNSYSHIITDAVYFVERVIFQF